MLEGKTEEKLMYSIISKVFSLNFTFEMLFLYMPHLEEKYKQKS